MSKIKERFKILGHNIREIKRNLTSKDKRYKVDAYNILSDLSKKGYQKATDFIKEKY